MKGKRKRGDNGKYGKISGREKGCEETRERVKESKKRKVMEGRGG